MAKRAKAAAVEAQDEATDLAVMAEVNPLLIFTDREKFSEFYTKLKAETDKHVPDISSERGRAAVRRLAFKVTKAKTTLEKAGLRLTEDWRRQTALVTASRKEMVAELDQLAAEVRKPLTDWEEAEDARVQRCRDIINGFKEAAIISVEDTSATVRQRGKEVFDAEIGDEFQDMADEATEAKDTAVATLGRAMNRLTQEEADRAELEQRRAADAEREEAERVAAEEAARKEQERLAAEEQERIAREREEAEALRIKDAEARAAEAAREEETRKAREAEEAREAEHQAALTEERRQREEAERIAREQREQREREDAEKDRQAEEDRLREANRAHRTRVQRTAKEAIMTCGADEDTARKIVLAIIAGEIPAVTLKF